MAQERQQGYLKQVRILQVYQYVNRYICLLQQLTTSSQQQSTVSHDIGAQNKHTATNTINTSASSIVQSGAQLPVASTKCRTPNIPSNQQYACISSELSPRLCSPISSGCWATTIVSRCVDLSAEQPLRVSVHVLLLYADCHFLQVQPVLLLCSWFCLTMASSFRTQPHICQLGHVLFAKKTGFLAQQLFIFAISA